MKLHDLFEGLVPAFKSQASLFANANLKLTDFAPIASAAQDYYLSCLDAKKIKHRPSSIVSHSGKYTCFLVCFAREAFRGNEIELAKITYLVNGRMNSFDCFYTRELQDILHPEHPIGSIMGPARYSNYLVVCQSVTAGGDINKFYPVIDEAVALILKCSVIGKAVIGSNVVVGSHCQVYSEDVPDDAAIKFVRNKSDGKERVFITSTRFHKSIKELFFVDA